jgi:hypothetical protein
VAAAKNNHENGISEENEEQASAKWLEINESGQ